MTRRWMPPSLASAVLAAAPGPGSPSRTASGSSAPHRSGASRSPAKTPNGHLRCTVTLPEGARARTQHRRADAHPEPHSTEGACRYGVSFGRLDISKDGVQLMRTMGPGLGLPPWSFDLRPHHSRRIAVDNTRVIWDGTLTLRPICYVSRSTCARSTSRSTIPAPTPFHPAAALAAGIFEDVRRVRSLHARARTTRVSTGRSRHPTDSALTPLDMHCWADVQQNAGFDLVDLFLVTPHDAPRLEPPILLEIVARAAPAASVHAGRSLAVRRHRRAHPGVTGGVAHLPYAGTSRRSLDHVLVTERTGGAATKDGCGALSWSMGDCAASASSSCG